MALRYGSRRRRRRKERRLGSSRWLANVYREDELKREKRRRQKITAFYASLDYMALVNRFMQKPLGQHQIAEEAAAAPATATSP